MSGPNGEPSVPVGQQEEEEAADEEYVALNLMLDQINSCLDNLEEKNDVLNAKLRELLESNRQNRNFSHYEGWHLILLIKRHK
ncbi:UPF0184 protein C9orf16 homolog isoform X3 [Chiloscyllium plagiosum]|uniref:UPF0184 protein C9orf16 homolog isoform X3 n=1 Tax=Chiloscyllium plagiosum TaxID=36176 RepID=UPI001CB7E407|nr:UPF0184 protein C9orf16 homolog isoform X3 [Chiloscyllium plagiosum]